MMWWIGALAAILVVRALWQTYYELFLSPLSSIPGPLLAKVTSKWLRILDMAGNRTLTIHNLHQKYGDSVRVGPNEISYSNPEIVKELYGQNTQYVKAPVYETFVTPPGGIFSMRDKAKHGQRRRLLSHAFSQSNLLNAEPIIAEVISKLVRHIKGKLSQPIDVLLLFRLTAFDVVGELFLGQPSKGLDELVTPALLEDIDEAFIVGSIKSVLPWVPGLFGILPIKIIQKYLEAASRATKHGQDAFENYVRQYGRDSGRRDLLTKILSIKSAEESPMTEPELYNEISNLIFAGTDTTSMTLTYLFWELARHSSWQTRLRDELAQNKGSDEVLPFQHVDELPLLSAVINESLRLHPAAPASLPRETPEGGRILNGIFIPEKTIVSMQCYTTQRDLRAFPDPNSFQPERWLGAGSWNSEVKGMFMPFSSGSRACLGKNLAMMELKIITATILRHFELHLAVDATEECMAMTDHFLVIPRGRKCNLIFKTVSQVSKHN